MNDLSITDIEPYMPRIADHISGLGIGIAHFGTVASQRIRGSWYAITKVLIDSPHKSGAVRALGKAGSPGNIRISDKLAGIIGNLLSLASRAGIAGG